MAKKFLTFDFETLATRPDAAVLSLGFLAFDLNDLPEVMTQEDVEDLRCQGGHVVFNMKSQVKDFGRLVNADTITWWKGQQSAADCIFKAEENHELADGIEIFLDYCKKNINNDTIIYIRGQDFDAPIMTSILDQLEIKHPYNHWKVRDTRTIIDVVWDVKNGYVPGFKQEIKDLQIIEHFALDDCIKDAIQITKSYKLLA